MSDMNTILVTGDIVLDCHLYGGVKANATSFSEPGTIYTQCLGGSYLTYELLQAAADAKGLDWDIARDEWQKENDIRLKKSMQPLPWSYTFSENRPSPKYKVKFGLVTEGLENELPKHLRSYGVWIDQPEKKGSMDRVWRIERHFGYGPTDLPKQGVVFKRDSTQSPTRPILTLIDDGGILYRHHSSREAWPVFSGDAVGYYLLKMSWPLCRGDLWENMASIMDRVIIVVSSRDLRREDVQINSHLSWEQCVENTIVALQNDPIVRDLLRAAHVVVNFGSAGALWVERKKDGLFRFHLLFDPELLEGDYPRQFDGSAYGFQTCLTAGIAHYLMPYDVETDSRKTLNPFSDTATFHQALFQGIAAGLTARRRLLELGHGPVDKQYPAFPIQALGQSIATCTGGFVIVDVPQDAEPSASCQWTILNQSEAVNSSQTTNPLTGLAHLTARYGFEALSHVPQFCLGKLFTVDRSEIESYRTLDNLIRTYEAVKVQSKPLSIGVFGPPGSGKSFGVQALAMGILGDKVPFIEFNLSQFKGPVELIGAFHRVRDAVLGGITPVVFWDEFDSQNYIWLQYLLAPMQDGSFQEGQITHPIGKCIFIFAGGTSNTMEEFGVEPPPDISAEDLKKLKVDERRERNELEKSYREFQLLKGPDFISRLHGFMNVLGPNSRLNPDCPDITWPIRRAIILRDILGLGAHEELDIDAGLLNALLNVSRYRHGARSFQKVVNSLMYGRHLNRLHRSALPPRPLLHRETDADEFIKLLTQRDSFKNHPDLEALAAAIHYNFLEDAKKSQVGEAIKNHPNLAWTIHPSIQKEYNDLDADFKAANRAAARRIPDHLALIGFTVEPLQPNDGDSWKSLLMATIDKHIERLAQSEHLGWRAERAANGWTFHTIRDNSLKHHPLMAPWAKLTLSDQEKDRSSIRSIPALLEMAKFKAVVGR